MIKAVFETNMKEMPQNCHECNFSENCPYPWLTPDKPKMRKPCFRKRHNKCPLIEEMSK